MDVLHLSVRAELEPVKITPKKVRCWNPGRACHLHPEISGLLKGCDCGRDFRGSGDWDESHRKAGSSQRKHPVHNCTPPTFPHCCRAEVHFTAGKCLAGYAALSSRAAGAPEESSWWSLPSASGTSLLAWLITSGVNYSTLCPWRPTKATCAAGNAT